MNERGKKTGDVSQSTLIQDARIMLAYFDKLIRYLPKEKYRDFTRSSHFVSYKRLYDKLGSYEAGRNIRV